VTEITAPGNLAPHAVALSANVTPVRHDSDSDFGTGRFIVLYDPDEPDSWGGPFRVVCFAQAPLETDIGVDPFLAEVAWAWLVDALDARGATYTSASGTATKVLSSGFGELASQGDGAQIELRASWSPQDSDLAAHVEGWSELLCMLAGLPPAGETASSVQSADDRASSGSSEPHPSSAPDRPVAAPENTPGGPSGQTMTQSSAVLHTLDVRAVGVDAGRHPAGTVSADLNTLGGPAVGLGTVGMRSSVGFSTAGTTTVAVTDLSAHRASRG